MTRTTIALTLTLGFGSSGCLLAAGIAESQRDAKVSDPLGDEFESPDGAIGWRAERADVTLKNLAWGTEEIGCAPVNAEGGGFEATCPKGTPTLVAKQNGKKLFRMCEAGTARVDCRSAWEKVARRIRHHRSKR